MNIKRHIVKRNLFAVLAAVTATSSLAYAQDVAILEGLLVALGVTAVAIFTALGGFNAIAMIASKTAAMFKGRTG